VHCGVVWRGVVGWGGKGFCQDCCMHTGRDVLNKVLSSGMAVVYSHVAACHMHTAPSCTHVQQCVLTQHHLPACLRAAVWVVFALCAAG
jgi:hypothetical protein